ncbi:MAG: lipocalin family protein [Gammaproteobacteria bacterium]|nr:lipocalin family protein [Gammaproteobacteria bacterium]
MPSCHKTIYLICAALFLSACAAKQPEMQTVDKVDIERFMGDWYVIANIPTFLEKDAYNAVESYRLDDDGTIATTFTFRKGSFDGKRKEYNPRGFIVDTESNALWGMRFVWPFKGDYRIVYLNDDYTQTVIGRQKRDYVWIMARTPEISAADYDRIVAFVESIGYDISKLQRVPQRW